MSLTNGLIGNYYVVVECELNVVFKPTWVFGKSIVADIFGYC